MDGHGSTIAASSIDNCPTPCTPFDRHSFALPRLNMDRNLIDNFCPNTHFSIDIFRCRSRDSDQHPFSVDR
jgi:hypothetical protein